MVAWLLVIVGCGLALAADTVPGYLGLGPCCFVTGLPFFLMAARLPGWLDNQSRPTLARRWQIRIGLTLAIALALSLTQVPKRFGFWLSRSAFESLLADAPAVHRGATLERRVGLYQIDSYAADAEGGVFFRTADGPDGFGPDRMSYGFAYRPHHTSCPFGHARFQTRHLFGDWYSFSVSDDY